MKKAIYKILYICLLAIAFIVLKSTEVHAATASLTASTTQPAEGEKVTVTASVTAGAWNLQFEGNGTNQTLYGYTQSNANASDTKTITFTAGSAGTKYTFLLKGDMTDITSDTSEQVSKTITITVKTPEVKPPQEPTTPTTPPSTTVTKSSEARLKNFGIKPNDFSGFKRDKYEYTTEVPNNVSEVEIYAEKLDNKATVQGTGKKQLKEGKNTFEVKVIAEDGKTTKTYKLTINRKAIEEEPTESGENRLKSLGIKPEEYDFTGFKSDVTEYSAEVPNEIEEIEVYAKAIDSNAQITGIGMIELKEGQNELKIEVIAENGDKKTYTLTVTRKTAETTTSPVEEKFGLSKLTIAGVTLSPKFDVETYEYTLNLSKDLSSLDITAKANDENATIEIVGNENLKQGENVITILVKNATTEKIATYQIIVNKNVVVEEVTMSWLKPSTWGKEEIIKIIIIVVLIILIISAIILKINIAKDSAKARKVDLPGAEELDKAIAEHQELVDEPSKMDKNLEDNSVEQNYIEEIAKDRFAVNEFEEKTKRRGRHF